MLKKIEFNIFILYVKETWTLRKCFVQGFIATVRDKVELVLEPVSDSFSIQAHRGSVSHTHFFS